MISEPGSDLLLMQPLGDAPVATRREMRSWIELQGFAQNSPAFAAGSTLGRSFGKFSTLRQWGKDT